MNPYLQVQPEPGIPFGSIAMVVVLVLLGLYLLSRFRVNQEYERAAIFRVGRSAGIKGAGLFWLTPLVDRAAKVDIRTKTREFVAQEMITADALSIKLNFVAWFKVVDAQRALVQVEDWQFSVGQACETTMRDVVGRKALSQLLADRTQINEGVRIVLASVTAAWGVEVERVEIKEIDIPETMQRAMAREAEAVREAAARVIKANGEYDAAARLKDAADLMAQSPGALQLRSLQTISEVGAEKNSVVVLALPMEAMGGAPALASAAMQRLPSQA